MTLLEDRHVTVVSGQSFAESARNFFGNIEVGFHDDDDTEVELISASLGSCRMSTINASPHGVKTNHVAQRSYDVDSIKLILQIEGHSTFEQEGRRHSFAPESWIVYDPTRPYRLNNLSRISQLLLQIPRQSLSSTVLKRLSIPLVFRDDLPGVPRVITALARSTMNEIAFLGDLARTRIGDTLGRLATTMISAEDSNASSEPRTLGILRARIKAHIESNLSRSSLDIEEIAQRMGCSRRYVFRAFQTADTTPSQYIWDLRLELTRERLTRNSPRETISEIAFSCGFASAAHFSRAFHKRYGMSPRDARRLGSV